MDNSFWLHHCKRAEQSAKKTGQILKIFTATHSLTPIMEQIISLLSILSEDQIAELKTRYGKSNVAAEKLIVLLLNGVRDEKELFGHLKVSVTTFNKTQTLAKDLVADLYKQKITSPLASVQIIQALIMKGELKTAQKFFTALEKENEQSQNWQMLDFLYHEGFRLAQMNGDIKFLEQVISKRSKYALQYAHYVKLYGEVMIEMVRGEKFEERKTDINTYLKSAQALNARAYAGGHHALIHNTLLILFHIYSRYFNEPEKTWQVVQKIMANHKRYETVMNRITDAIIRLNVINFLCVYDTFGSPEKYLAETWKRIDRGGVLARANLINALLGYYLSIGDVVNAKKYLKELENVQDKTHFAPYKSVVRAILCFKEGNYDGFKFYLNLFYEDPNHINLPDSEVIVRILELIVLKNEMSEEGGVKQMSDEQYYQSKADALRVYFNRNLNKVRYAEEFDILTYLTTPSAKNKAKVQQLHNSKYRNSKMLAKYVLETTM